MAKGSLSGMVPTEPLLRQWHASFRARADAWRYFTACEAPGLRLDGDDYYGWQITSRNLDAEQRWGLVP